MPRYMKPFPIPLSTHHMALRMPKSNGSQSQQIAVQIP